MSAPAVDEYGNPMEFEPGKPHWSSMVSAVVARANAHALLVIEEPGRWLELVRYDDKGHPAAIAHVTPLFGNDCCGRTQIDSLTVMTRADQRRRGLMRDLYRELDGRGYCVLHPHHVDRTPEGEALAAAIAAELAPHGERQATAAPQFLDPRRR